MERNDRRSDIEDERQLHPGDIIEAGLTRRRWHALVIGARQDLPENVLSSSATCLLTRSSRTSCVRQESRR